MVVVHWSILRPKYIHVWYNPSLSLIWLWFTHNSLCLRIHVNGSFKICHGPFSHISFIGPFALILSPLELMVIIDSSHTCSSLSWQIQVHVNITHFKYQIQFKNQENFIKIANCNHYNVHYMRKYKKSELWPNVDYGQQLTFWSILTKVNQILKP